MEEASDLTSPTVVKKPITVVRKPVAVVAAKKQVTVVAAKKPVNVVAAKKPVSVVEKKLLAVADGGGPGVGVEGEVGLELDWR